MGEGSVGSGVRIMKLEELAEQSPGCFPVSVHLLWLSCLPPLSLALFSTRRPCSSASLPPVSIALPSSTLLLIPICTPCFLRPYVHSSWPGRSSVVVAVSGCASSWPLSFSILFKPLPPPFSLTFCASNSTRDDLLSRGKPLHVLHRTSLSASRRALRSSLVLVLLRLPFSLFTRYSPSCFERWTWGTPRS